MKKCAARERERENARENVTVTARVTCEQALSPHEITCCDGPPEKEPFFWFDNKFFGGMKTVSLHANQGILLERSCTKL